MNFTWELAKHLTHLDLAVYKSCLEKVQSADLNLKFYLFPDQRVARGQRFDLGICSSSLF